MEEAQELLGQAKAVEGSDPLTAAELYVAGIRLLRQARSTAGAGPDGERLDGAIRIAMKRFGECEARVKSSKQNSAVKHTQGGGEGGAPPAVATLPPPKQQPAATGGGGGKERGLPAAAERGNKKSWFGDLFGGGKGAKEGAGSPTHAAQAYGAPRDVFMPFRSNPHPATSKSAPGSGASATRSASEDSGGGGKGREGASLQGIDKALAHTVLDEIIDNSSIEVRFDDIAGLKDAKTALTEAVMLPALRPDLFQGLRAPPRGILLFGPPGTGKTLLAKALATESNCRFFNISASSLTSKYVGQAEKMVRALFAVAAQLQPSIVFIDEVDSVLGARSENEHEASRRLKTEFLLQFDGVGTDSKSRVIVIGATNRPQELDDAVRRRFTKRLYIPLPEKETRIQLMAHLLKGQKTSLTKRDLDAIGDMSRGFSGSDLAALCKDSAMGPIRDLGKRIQEAKASDVRAINMEDMLTSLRSTRSSVSMEQVRHLEEWNEEFGSYKVPQTDVDSSGKSPPPPPPSPRDSDSAGFAGEVLPVMLGRTFGT